MIKTKKDYHFGRGTASALVVFVLALAFLSFFEGSQTLGETATVAQTTFFSTQNFTIYSTVTQPSIQYITVTRSNYTTVDFIGPDTVTVSGTASAQGLGGVGASATLVIFRAQSNTTYTAVVSGGAYSISVPNHQFYTVYIRYTTAIGGIGSGPCTAGGLGVFITGNAMTANWSC